jgi:hypothetical protein
MIVQNISGRDIKILEMQKVLKAGSSYVQMPYEIAYKYRKYLKPIQLQNTLLNNNVKDEVEVEAIQPNIIPEITKEELEVKKGNITEQPKIVTEEVIKETEPVTKEVIEEVEIITEDELETEPGMDEVEIITEEVEPVTEEVIEVNPAPYKKSKKRNKRSK